MPLFSQKGRMRSVVILDVQSSIVRGSLAYVGDMHALPQVAFTTSAHIPHKPHTDSSYFVKVTLKAVSEVMDTLLRHIHSTHTDQSTSIREIHLVLSSPWIVSQAKTLSFEFPKPVIITHAYLMQMIDAERDKLAPTREKIRVIEEKIFNVRLNGYSLTSWEEKSASKLQVSYTVSVASNRLIERFVSACSHVVKADHITLHSSLVLQHVGYESVSRTSDYYALLHVHGELTDIAIIRGHACVFFGSIPVGIRTIVRKIATNSDHDVPSAESLLTLYIGNQLDPDHTKNETETIRNVVDGWASDVKKLLSSSGFDQSIPACIVSATAHDEFFAHQLTAVFPKARMHIISVEELAPHLEFLNKAEHDRLTTLYVLALQNMNVHA